jgi:acyl-CoA thioesterase I
MRVLVFGDSIAQGFFAETAGWVQRLFNFYGAEILKDQSGDWVLVFNLGISGDRTAWLNERLESEIKTRTKHLPHEELLLVFAIGVNDTGLDDGRERSTPAEYERNLTELITKAKKFSEKIIMVGITACEEEVVNGRTYKSKHVSNDRIKEFENTLASVSEDKRVSYVPVFDEFKAKLDKGEELLADGIHPNDKGHQLIYELVKPELDKLINT